jgi:radical SAM protein with 4Fe4S-binding SPASM domain
MNKVYIGYDITNIVEIRDKQYTQHVAYDLLSSLKSVEINPSESCTRKCGFCPRSNSQLYPSTHTRISVELCEKIGRDLADIGFTNHVGFVGFGEPLMHKHLEKCISAIRQHNPNLEYLEINTNGDLLTYDRIKSLYEAGCNVIAVSMYDSDMTTHFNALKGDVPIQMVYRHHYDASINYGLNIVNRKEIAFDNNLLNIQKACYRPFYKLFIDWNGDVLTCDNDWARTLTLGNVGQQSIREVWLGKAYNQFKSKLLHGRNHAPCNKCNACGTLRGETEYNLFNEAARLEQQ